MNRLTTITHQICTPRLLLRCWHPADAPLLIDAINSSLNELRAWLPWAKDEPEGAAAKAERLQQFRNQFERGETFIWGVFDLDQSRVIGSAGSHGRIGAGAREVGYWIRTDETGKGFATEAASALIRVGMEIEKLRRMEIHCHPQNLASAAVPRKLKLQHAVTIRNCVRDPTIGPRDTSIYFTSPTIHQSSPAAELPIEAFDVLGNRIAGA